MKPFPMWMYKWAECGTKSHGEIFQSDQKEALEADGWVDNPSKLKGFLDVVNDNAGSERNPQSDQVMAETCFNLSKEENMLLRIEDGIRSKKDLTDFVFQVYGLQLEQGTIGEMREAVKKLIENGGPDDKQDTTH